MVLWRPSNKINYTEQELSYMGFGCDNIIYILVNKSFYHLASIKKMPILLKISLTKRNVSTKKWLHNCSLLWDVDLQSINHNKCFRDKQNYDYMVIAKSSTWLSNKLRINVLLLFIFYYLLLVSEQLLAIIITGKLNHRG